MYFRKAMPSVFSELKFLYSDEAKVKVTEELILGHILNLESKN